MLTKKEKNRRAYIKRISKQGQTIKTANVSLLELTDEEFESVYRSGMNNLRIKLAREGYTCQELIVFILNLEIN